MTYLASAKRTFSQQISTLQVLQDSLDASFTQACDLLFSCKGKVVVSGMGKSGHVGKKIAATLASTGTPSFFMHPGEANHGDFGMLGKEDVLIAISNSGETAELIGLLPSVKRIGVPIISITNKPDSHLAQFSDVVLTLNVKQESCALNLAPTTSTTATLVLGDAIAVALLEEKGFTAEDFAFSHPGGSLGKRLLLTVKDIMVIQSDIPTVQDNASVRDALLEISAKGLGITAIIDKHMHILGIFSDGDLRRALDKRIDVHETPVKDVMTKSGVTIVDSALAVDAINLMQNKKINALFVIDDNKRLVGALNMHMLLKAGVV